MYNGSSLAPRIASGVGVASVQSQTMRRLVNHPNILYNPMTVVRWVRCYERPSFVLRRRARNQRTPPITSVLIEISSNCNRKCHFCPNAHHKRSTGFLDEDVVHKVIRELAELGFKGGVSFNLFNEPLLDKRLLSFLQYTRDILPKAFIYLNTNGDLLNVERWKKLRAVGLDFANVSQYDGKLNSNIRQLLSKLSYRERGHLFAHVFLRDLIQNRAGLVESERRLKLPVQRFCPRPFYQLCINYEGKVVLCCNDFFGAVQFGDVRKETVAAIWAGDEIRHYRERLLAADRASLDLCKSCDI